MGRCYQRNALICLVLCLSGLCLAGCVPDWLITVHDAQGAYPVRQKDWQTWSRAFPGDVQGRTAIRLERILAETSGLPLASLEVAGKQHGWEDVRFDSWLNRDGQVCVLGDCAKVDEVLLVGPTGAPLPTFDVMGLAPTIAGTLKSPSPEKTNAHALGAFVADQVLLIFVDGLGYEQAMAVRGAKVTPFLDTLGLPQPTLTVYPSQGMVPLAAALSGADPRRNGIVEGGSVELQVETLLDVLAKTGRGALLIETHEAVLDVAKQQLVHLSAQEGQAFDWAADEMEDREQALVVLRLASLERDAQAYGLQSDAYLDSLNRVDQELAHLIIGLPDGVLVLITSGYGMHGVQGEDALAANGSLLFEDMVVPLWLIQI